VAILCTPEAHIRDQYSVEIDSLAGCGCEGDLCSKLLENNFTVSPPDTTCNAAMSSLTDEDQNLIYAYIAEVKGVTSSTTMLRNGETLQKDDVNLLYTYIQNIITIPIAAHAQLTSRDITLNTFSTRRDYVAYVNQIMDEIEIGLSASSVAYATGNPWLRLAQHDGEIQAHLGVLAQTMMHSNTLNLFKIVQEHISNSSSSGMAEKFFNYCNNAKCEMLQTEDLFSALITSAGTVGVIFTSGIVIGRLLWNVFHSGMTSIRHEATVRKSMRRPVKKVESKSSQEGGEGQGGDNANDHC